MLAVPLDGRNSSLEIHFGRFNQSVEDCSEVGGSWLFTLSVFRNFYLFTNRQTFTLVQGLSLRKTLIPQCFKMLLEIVFLDIIYLAQEFD